MTSPTVPQGVLGQLQAIVRDERRALLKLARDTRLATTIVPALTGTEFES